jgi:signal transduction histidine kinase
MLWLMLYIEGAQATTQIEAYILSNMQGPCLIVLNFIFGVKPLDEEWKGLLIQLAGATLIVLDPLSKRADHYDPPNSVLFKLILSSLIGSAFLLFNDKYTKRYRVFFLVFYQSVQMYVITSIAAVIISNGRASFISIDPTWGCLGFLAPGHFENIFLLQGLLSGLAGGFG